MYLPLYMNLSEKRVLVVGLGEVGLRRARKLREHGAKVTAIDRDSAEIEGVEVLRRELGSENIPDLEDFFLVVAATDDEELNSAIAEEARDEGVLVNLAGDFKGGDLVFPAVTEVRGDKVSFTTLGEDPSLAKTIRELIEDELSAD